MAKKVSLSLGAQRGLQRIMGTKLFEHAPVFARFDHFASGIENADHYIM
jgi:hypothetical protein